MTYPNEDVFDDPEQFWDNLSSTVNTQCGSHEQIDDILRAWLDLVSTARDRFLHNEIDLARCSRCLLESPLCAAPAVRDYVQTQIVYSLLQEDESRPLHAIANYLLLAGRYDEAVFRQMIDAGCFARLVELLKNRREDDRRLHRLLLELMYEMARIERVRIADLLHVDDGFVSYLFQIIEDLSDDIDDPYHYPVIRVLLVLNEQYMVAATTAAVDAASDTAGAAPGAPLTNRVVKILSSHGVHFRTFGENIILLLNRATETALQLLILKLLYLLFTTHATYEYFYTNDLRVLVDVIIRNLLDLPDESAALRHTYLRVFYPLLAHTQLNQPPQYKRDEILRVLAILSGSGNAHFARADETTLRLVNRVSSVAWLAEAVTPPESPSPGSLEADTDTAEADAPYIIDKASFATATTRTSIASSAGSYLTASSSSTTTDDELQQQQQRQHNTVVNKFLGISLGSGDDNSGRESRTSVASVADVAAVKEKPGVKTPSRKVAAEAAASQSTDTTDATLASTAEAATAADSVAAYLGDTGLTGLTDLQKQPVPSLQLEQSTPTPTSTAASTPPLPPPPPSHPPGHKARAKRVKPAVPTHRHGVPVKAQPPPPPQHRQATPPPRPPPPPSHTPSPSPSQAQPQTAEAEAAAGTALAGAGVSPRTVTNGDSYNVVASEAHPTAAAAAAAATAATAAHGHSHAHNTGVKKLPPKLPPPRRVGRLKAAASNMHLRQSAIDPSAD